jgi:endonuclease-3
MCAIMLAAATTDAAVNRALPGFLRRYPTPASVLGASKDEMVALLPAIAHTGAKCDYIAGWAKRLVENNGKYPTDLAELTKLSGIGRKTGGLFLWALRRSDESFPLDTHCLRVFDRLGWYSAKTPKALERQLMADFPAGQRNKAHILLTQFGRNHCTHANPKCGSCPLNSICQYAQKAAVS